MPGVQACSVAACLATDQSILFETLVPLYPLGYPLVGQRTLGFFAETSVIGLVNCSGVTLELHRSLIHVACPFLLFLILIGLI